MNTKGQLEGDKKYLRKLLYTAEQYVGETYHGYDQVQFFYRNKPEDYFSEVRRNNNTLSKIKKDFNGDRRSPINNKISGVFLGVTLWQGRLPTASPFGGVRICFPIAAVYKETCQLYFTDFYCTKSENHYVTLVLTPAGSQEDVFCEQRCIKLDPENNKFLRRSPNSDWNNTIPGRLGDFTTVRRYKLHVEVFYTENVYLDAITAKFGPEKVFYSNTGIIGKGTSTWGGLRKNTSCGHCNPSLSTPEVTYSEAKRKQPTTKESSVIVVPKSYYQQVPQSPRSTVSSSSSGSARVQSSSNRQLQGPSHRSSLDSYSSAVLIQQKHRPAYYEPEPETDCGKKCCIIM